MCSVVDVGQIDGLVGARAAGALRVGRGRTDAVYERLLVVLEHALELRNRVLILDHAILELMALVAEIGEHRVLLDEHLLDALVLGERVGVHLAQVVELGGEAHERLVGLDGLLVALELVVCAQLLELEREPLLLGVDRGQLLGEHVVLVAVAVDVRQQLLVLLVQVVALLALHLELVHELLVLRLQLLEFAEHLGDLALAVRLERLLLGLEQRVAFVYHGRVGLRLAQVDAGRVGTRGRRLELLVGGLLVGHVLVELGLDACELLLDGVLHEERLGELLLHEARLAYRLLQVLLGHVVLLAQQLDLVAERLLRALELVVAALQLLDHGPHVAVGELELLLEYLVLLDELLRLLVLLDELVELGAQRHVVLLHVRVLGLDLAEAIARQVGQLVVFLLQLGQLARQLTVLLHQALVLEPQVVVLGLELHRLARRRLLLLAAAASRGRWQVQVRGSHQRARVVQLAAARVVRRVVGELGEKRILAVHHPRHTTN